MNGSNRGLLSVWLALFMLGFANGAAAVVITYQAIDLPDAVAGKDLWQYRYRVSGSFVFGGGFNVLFSPTLYFKLEDPPPAVNGDWIIATTQPNVPPSADGLYRATALFGNPSVTDPFMLNFVWLGQGGPGSQPFEVFDESFFPPIAVGQTRAEVQIPLPDTLTLIGLGLLALRARNAVTRPR